VESYLTDLRFVADMFFTVPETQAFLVAAAALAKSLSGTCSMFWASWLAFRRAAPLTRLADVPPLSTSVALLGVKASTLLPDFRLTSFLPNFPSALFFASLCDFDSDISVLPFISYDDLVR